jgi:4,5-dihydroxyphthalate decarboxylase
MQFVTPEPVLKTLLGNYTNTLPLKNGKLKPSGFSFEFADVKVPNRAFKRVVREQEFDVAELAMVTCLQAIAYNKPYAMIPAVIGAGRYQHHCLVYNAERQTLRVGQLKGKRIGIRAHAQTTVTWVRGILWDDYGVALDDVNWVTMEDGHLAEFPDPPHITRAPEGRTMVNMLLSGDLDAAIIGTDLPDDPRLQPVLPDPHAAAQAWSLRNQTVPINHMVMVRKDMFQHRPDFVTQIYRLLAQSKAHAEGSQPTAMDLTPFGVEANRKALEVLIRNATDQKLLPRPLTVDEIFEDFYKLNIPNTTDLA